MDVLESPALISSFTAVALLLSGAISNIMVGRERHRLRNKNLTRGYAGLSALQSVLPSEEIGNINELAPITINIAEKQNIQSWIELSRRPVITLSRIDAESRSTDKLAFIVRLIGYSQLSLFPGTRVLVPSRLRVGVFWPMISAYLPAIFFTIGVISTYSLVFSIFAAIVTFERSTRLIVDRKADEIGLFLFSQKGITVDNRERELFDHFFRLLHLRDSITIFTALIVLFILGTP